MTESITEGIPPRSWIILGVVAFLVVILNFDFTSVNLALVTISQATHSDLDTIQWMLSGYVLMLSAFVIPAGRLSDIYGKRNVFFWGAFFFAGSSFLIGVTDNIWIAILGRFFQGLGAALFVPTIYAMVFMAFPIAKRGMAIGLVAAAAGLGLALGPTIGAFIIEVSSWRWIFFINLPLCAIAATVLYSVTEKEQKPETREKLDIPGMFLLVVSLIVIMFGLNKSSDWGIASAPFVGVIAAGAFLIFLFVRNQQKQKSPLLPLDLLRNKSFLICISLYISFQYIFSTSLFISGLYMQSILNYTPAYAGTVFMAMTLSMGALSPFGGTMTDKWGGRLPITLGMCLLCIASIFFARLTSYSSVLNMVSVLIPLGVGLGLCISSINAIMLKSVKKDELSTASGAFCGIGMFANALSVVLNTEILIWLGKSNVFALIQKSGLALSVAQKQIVASLMSSTHYELSRIAKFSPDILSQLMIYIDESFVGAMSVVMTITASIAAIAAFIAARKLKSIKEIQSIAKAA
ncbi:MAG: MFS transporter [Alphaproteobacteria bacterium]|jgi:EmrB/QacA subfamily drug resistance transporter|nr:MFS transporter [Alphaproteobacteria bacterium]MBT5389227.1 MFS transporter [Alphaproteobacteria bacterium]MBT5654325.1 MFS transporter [Alphaproteobacteria bacterium]